MVKIFVAVVGVGVVFSVDIDISQTVHDLKKTIKAEDPSIFAQFGAGRLKLYLARDGGEWLNLTDDDMEVLENKKVPDRFKSLMQKPLLPTAKLDRADCFGDFSPGDDEIHVLVEVPDAPSDALSSRSASSSALIEEPLENPLLNEAATPYMQTAETLKDLDEVVELENAIEYVRGQSSDPFIVLESSSGMGKTQMAFNLMARGNLDVFYLVCEGIVTKSQRVYKAFGVQSSMFLECVHQDMPRIILSKTPDALQIGILSGGLYTYGFIHALLRGMVTTELRVSRRTVTEQLRAHPKLVFFLDEFPQPDNDHSEVSVMRLRFMRNVFRSLSIPVVLSSTHGTARSLVITCSLSRGDDRPLWCVVLPQMPRFQDARTSGVRPTVLRYIIEHSRPLFARFALKYIVEHPFHGGNLCEYLDDMMFSLATSSRDWKTWSKKWFIVGQVCLFLSASYKADRRGGLIHRHFARLHETKQFELRLFSDKVVKSPPDKGTKAETGWECQAVFPPVHEDVLLYLSLLGGRWHRPFEPDGGRDMLFATAFDKVAKRLVEAGMNYSNSFQRTNDGMRFEALTVGAVLLASHRNGFTGIMVDEFLTVLMHELGVYETPLPYRRWIPTALDIRVPFLAPPGQEWPQELLDSDLQLGRLHREVNETGIDWSAVDGLLTGECKDYSKALDLGTMRKILMRVPSSSHLHVVVTNVLQESYFTQASFGEFLNELRRAGRTDLSHTHFFRAGPGYGPVEIRGMENRCRLETCYGSLCQLVERVVVFIDIKSKHPPDHDDEMDDDSAGQVSGESDAEMSDSS